MGKVIIDGKEAEPCKKVNLAKTKSAVEIRDLLLKKVEELKHANASKDNK